MREIKFRIWDKQKNQWFTPIYQAYENQLEELTIGLTGDIYLRNMGGVEHESVFLDRFGDWQQFTGLLDKNGKEIYEGDIIQWHVEEGQEYIVSNDDEDPLKRIVIWLDDDAKFGWKHLSGDLDQSGYSFTKRNFESMGEVIGNVIENPELLK